MRKIGRALPGHGAAPTAFTATIWEEAAAAAIAHAPYLRRLIDRREDLCESVDESWPQHLLDAALAEAHTMAAAPPPIADAVYRLRRAKDAVHLATAIADLAGAWPLARVTGALTDFADASLRAAVAVAGAEGVRRGDISAAAVDMPEVAIPGFSLIAMGKMGAAELNYSSDIDFSVFFDTEILANAGAREPRVTAVRLVAPLVRVLEEVTADGYVFRTDLRLRPDPGSTPVAVSTASAEHYYQTLGQNWERCAFIKARAAAGDRACGAAFLASLEPFIWRKHLDFAAVEDVHSIKRQILSAHKSAELDEAVFDVKLGRGGIRDIELFAQTQQLILGGRNRKLRVSGTLAALDALTEGGAISASARDELHAAYVFLREVEHRVQMLEDAQTHRIPGEAETRAHVAALCGYASLAEFDASLIETRRVVADIDHQLFGRGESLADPMGSLIFTGVEDHPETLATIGKLGFTDPAAVSGVIRGWHHGRVRAMRSERARELLTRLTPRLLRAFADAGDPDHVFERFAAFFSGLVAGVQVLALLDARPALLDFLAKLLAIAPRFADNLSRRPALLDALIEPRFAQALSADAPGARAAELAARLDDAEAFEARMNAARRFQREEAFRIEAQVLEGGVDSIAAGAAFSNLAEACVEAMARAALAEMESHHGLQPGVFAVFALGKFGGWELTATSDLDIMIVYDPRDSVGLPAPDYYARLSQRLISALSAPTEEGVLYEIDTKLRPSGSKGPVAVRLSSFERYYAEEAWTWELLALTRLRPVAGDAALGRRVMDIARSTLSRARDGAKIRADVADMRALMERERPGKGLWDLKLAPGGLVDIEFAAQALQLIHGRATLNQNTSEALDLSVRAGALEQASGARLVAAWRLLSDLSQVLRASVEGAFDPARAPAPLRARLARAAGLETTEALEAELARAKQAVRAEFFRILDISSDGTGASAR